MDSSVGYLYRCRRVQQQDALYTEAGTFSIDEGNSGLNPCSTTQLMHETIVNLSPTFSKGTQSIDRILLSLNKVK